MDDVRGELRELSRKTRDDDGIEAFLTRDVDDANAGELGTKRSPRAHRDDDGIVPTLLELP